MPLTFVLDDTVGSPPLFKGGEPDFWIFQKGGNQIKNFRVGEKKGGNFQKKRGNTVFQKMKLVIIKNIMLHGQLIFSKIIFYFGQFTLDKWIFSIWDYAGEAMSITACVKCYSAYITVKNI